MEGLLWYTFRKWRKVQWSMTMKKLIPLILILVLPACGPGETTKKLQVTPAQNAAPAQAVKQAEPVPAPKVEPVPVPAPAQAAATDPVPPVEAGTLVTPSGIAYAPPSGWVAEPPQGMREVSFKIDAAPEAECYISVLKGAAGGVEMNLNRWRNQIGQTPLTEGEIAALPKAKVMGKDAPLLEAKGAYQGMEDKAKEGYALLGTMADWNGRMVFVKMTGPEAQVTAQKDAFLALCESLK
jgi:hypothetical protein